MPGDKYELPKQIERHLAALSRLYAQDGQRDLQEIIVNAQIRLIEGWAVEGWDDEYHGHALYLVIPEPLFLPAAKRREEIQSKIRGDLNSVHNVRHEHIAEVFLEMDLAEDHDWRQESGLLIATNKTVAPDSVTRIWGDSGFRVFLSHKAEVGRQAADLKERLGVFGITAFVAHADIRPTRAWQAEIENALHSMDAFVALMTDGFHDSDWTDQEVGFALARGVPVIAVRLGLDPYGFLGKFQALLADWNSAPEGIVRLLMKHDRMFTAYLQALRACPSWDRGNTLALALPGIEQATEQQIENENTEVRYSFGFRGNKPAQYGDGLIPHLHRLGPRQFVRDSDQVISVVKARRRRIVEDEVQL